MSKNELKKNEKKISRIKKKRSVSVNEKEKKKRKEVK
jgi:hypothetical protein